MGRLALLLALQLPAARASGCEVEAACEPVVLVPGVMGSRLRQHRRMPGSLETVSQHLWLPESHKLMMRSAILGPVSSGNYWSWVNSLNPLYSIPGARVEPDRTNWGVKGVSCILKTGRECVAGAKVFWDMVVSLERAGYRAGIQLYGVPYDWRLGPDENKLCADLAHVLHRITNTTSHRKALLVAHSLGNLQVLYCLQRVFGIETITKIKALVSIAPPWAGAPQLARVMTSGAEMVSKVIITNAETRDFTRQLSGPYMLLPHERLWGNSTIMTFQEGERDQRATAKPTSSSAGKPDADGGTDRAEEYKGSQAGLKALFRKIEAHAPHSASGMRAMYERSLGLVDVWQAPPLPVVCVIGSGKPTIVHFGYCESWPNVFNEEPRALKYEDGDTTVPRRSAESVCRAWQRHCYVDKIASLSGAHLHLRQRCHTTLAGVHKSRYRSRDDECIDVVLMHCRLPSMESVGMPRGVNHCDEFHQRILHKTPTIDLVHELAANLHAYEPSYSAALEQLHDLTRDIVWLHNAAARRLATVATISNAIDAASPSSRGVARWTTDSSISSMVRQLQSGWEACKQREHFTHILAALDSVAAAVSRAERRAHPTPPADGHLEVESRIVQADREWQPLLRAADRVTSALAALAEGCGNTTSGASARGFKPKIDSKFGEEVRGGKSNMRRAGQSETMRPQGLEWGDADLSGSGLPDCPKAFETASHRFYRQFDHESSAARREREMRRLLKCALHHAVTTHLPPFQRFRSQLEWNIIHWQRLRARLRQPVSTHATTPELLNAPYASALYGKMQDSDMDVTHGR